MIYTIVLISLFLFSQTLSAQQDTTGTKPVLIELKDGSKITGNILEETENMLVVKTAEELEIKIPKNKIASRKILSHEPITPKNEIRDYNRHRLLISPTGRNIKKGDVYIADYELFLPIVGIGITDIFSVSGGITLIPGIKNQLIFLSPKFTPIQYEDFYGSVGLIFAGVFGESFGTLIYASTSFGGEDFSATLGYGTAIFGEEIFKASTIMFGGDAKISRSTKIIVDNMYYVFSEEGLSSLGFRIFGEHLSGEFGLIYPWSFSHSSYGFPFIPWLSVSYKF